ncbi:MAG: CBS domain-containing protein [Halodesulfurarchaeum sp.]|nr:CBS domain-containing protein [Halodesulfurarchaeum sp.]
MTIADLMSTDLVTVPLGATLDRAVDEMLGNGVGSVVVIDGEDAVGIITETDVLAAGSGTERPFGDIPVSRAMSPNPVTIGPEEPPESAIGRMQEYGIKKLVVEDGGDLQGILTTTDLVSYRTDFAEALVAIDFEPPAPDS